MPYNYIHFTDDLLPFILAPYNYTNLHFTDDLLPFVELFSV